MLRTHQIVERFWKNQNEKRLKCLMLHHYGDICRRGKRRRLLERGTTTLLTVKQNNRFRTEHSVSYIRKTKVLYIGLHPALIENK